MEAQNRRSFIKKSTSALAGIGLYTSMPISYASKAPSDRVNIGVIGLGFGATNMRIMMEANAFVHCIAMCDVDQIKLEERASALKGKFPLNAGKIKLYNDFRKLIENKDIDGVIIATPDHWHALAQDYGRFPDPEHKADFIDAIRNERRPNADIEEGHRSTLLSQYANISYRLGGVKLKLGINAQDFTLPFRVLRGIRGGSAGASDQTTPLSVLVLLPKRSTSSPRC